MTEMPVFGSDEGSDPLMDALTAFTGAMGEALPDVCSYGLTIGETYVPFDPDPEDECDGDEAMCSQVWVRVTDVNIKSLNSFGNDCSATMEVGLEVGVLRCIEIESGGEAPSASEVLAASMQSMADMRALYCAAMGLPDETFIGLDAGQWSPVGPMGGQYGGVWTFVAEV